MKKLNYDIDTLSSSKLNLLSMINVINDRFFCYDIREVLFTNEGVYIAKQCFGRLKSSKESSVFEFVFNINEHLNNGNFCGDYYLEFYGYDKFSHEYFSEFISLDKFLKDSVRSCLSDVEGVVFRG